MKSKCKVSRSRIAVTVLASLVLFSATEGYAQQKDKSNTAASKQLAGNVEKKAKPKKKPVIKQFPNTPVWSDLETALKEFPGFAFVGEYIKDNQALQVTAADGKFYLSLYTGGFPSAGWDGEAIVHQWVDADSIEKRLSGWEKVDRSSKFTGKKPPEGAIILFDGSDAVLWNNGKLENGLLKAGTSTIQKFKDFHLYLEFLVPFKPEPPICHPHRGNSGVFALGAYEIQIADTFALDPAPSAWGEGELLKPVNTWCGSIYGIRVADHHVCLPPLSWQSMEIEFKAARFKDGVKTSPAVISVIHNGVKIHDQITLPEGTGGGRSGPRPEVPEGPIYLQNHGNPNLFRNIWIKKGNEK